MQSSLIDFQDYGKVIEYSKYDKRLGNSHWNVPGPDGDFGYGGHCFPKDMAALKFLANLLGVDTSVLDGVIKKNDQVRIERDWDDGVLGNIYKGVVNRVAVGINSAFVTFPNNWPSFLSVIRSQIDLSERWGLSIFMIE